MISKFQTSIDKPKIVDGMKAIHQNKNNPTCDCGQIYYFTLTLCNLYAVTKLSL